MNDKEKQIEEMAKVKFSVIDNESGKYPDLYNIALKEDWAKGLMYCDMEGFAINEDGNLVLLDECGGVAYCPKDRFTIVFEDSVVLTKGAYESLSSKAKANVVNAVEIKKETVEKFYLSFIDEIMRGCGDDKDFWVVKLINKKAKQFGVEIKE